jgi:hypothetical protein
MAGEPVDGDEEDFEVADPVEDAEPEADNPDDSSAEADEETTPDNPDAVEASPDQQPPSRQQQPSRGERRFQSLTSELAKERQQREDLSRRLDAALGQQRQPVQETPEARAQRHALMTPEERMREDLQNATATHQRDMRVMQFQMQDNSDKTAFEAKAAVDKRYAKWKPDVERELLALRQQGQNVDREKLMYYLIGKNAVENGQVQVAQQRSEARQRVQRQSVRPSNSGSDVQASRRDRSATLEKRLENQSL